MANPFDLIEARGRADQHIDGASAALGKIAARLERGPATEVRQSIAREVRSLRADLEAAHGELGTVIQHLKQLRPGRARLALGLAAGGGGLALALSGQFWGLAVAYLSAGMALDDARTFADLGADIGRLESRQGRIMELLRTADETLKRLGL